MRSRRNAVLAEARGQRLAQGRQLGPQPALGQLGQRLGVGHAVDEGVQHRPSRDAHDVGRDRGQLHAGVLEQLVHAVDLAGALVAERLAVAGEVPQLADRRRRHEAGTQQPVGQQLGDPDRVDGVGLASGDVLEVGGVDEQQLEVVLQQVVGRLAVHAGRLHRHVRHPQLREPVAQRQQIRRGRPE
jgi:hypothetical protein